MSQSETTNSSSSFTSSTESLRELLEPLTGNRRRLYLVRHGETDMNAKGILQGDGIDSVLTHKGQSQARSVAKILADQPIQVVLSSDLKRSVETASIVHKALAASSPGSYVSRVTSPKFREMKFGRFEGTAILRKDCPLSIKIRFALCRRAMRKNHDKQWPGGESIAELHRRAMDGLTPIMEQISNHTVCLVAHGAFNKLLIHCLTGIDEREIQQSNTGVSVLDYDPSTGVWTPQVLDFDRHAAVHSSSPRESNHLSTSLVAPRQSVKMSFRNSIMVKKPMTTQSEIPLEKAKNETTTKPKEASASGRRRWIGGIFHHHEDSSKKSNSSRYQRESGSIGQKTASMCSSSSGSSLEVH